MDSVSPSPKPRRRKGEGSVKYEASRNRWRGQLVVDGKTYYVQRPTQDEALAALAALRTNLAKNIEPKTTLETVGHFLDRWLETHLFPVESTKTTYCHHIEHHLKPALGKIPLTKLTTADVQKLINHHVRAERLSPRSIEYMRNTLRVALNDAIRWDLLGRNVAALVKLPPKEKKDVQPLSPEQGRVFLAAIHGDELEALYLVAINCGLRLGELLALRWEYTDRRQLVRDVDLDAKLVTVRAGLKKENGEYVIKMTKTRRSRTQTLPEGTLDPLRAHRRRQIERRLEVGAAWQEWGLVFPRADGAPMNGSQATHHLYVICKRAKLPRANFIVLRHSMASFHVAMGTPLRDLADLMGHSQISLTANLYSHLYPAARVAAAARMDELLGDKSDAQ